MRFLLVAILVLVGLLVLDRVSRESPAEPLPVAAPAPAPAPPPVQVPPAQVAGTAASQPASLTPTTDLLARLYSRRTIIRLGSAVYLDSMLTDSDSIVRRWPDRGGAPLRVAILAGEAPAASLPRLTRILERALRTWAGAGAGIGLELAADSTTADIRVQWVARLDAERSGETEIQWSRSGAISGASVSLALTTSDGRQLPDEGVYVVATHEIGHAIGVPHSANPADVMFPVSRTGILSARDRATLTLLYQLPPGSLRDSGME